MPRKDYRSEPVKSLVVMGESNAFGMCAGDPRNEWVQVLANGIRDAQEEPVRVYNNAIPSNVMSPDTPGYAGPEDKYRTAPSVLERFEQDMIGYAPDLAVYAYGLADALCANPLANFIRDYRTVVTKTREALPDALLVLVGPYWNVIHDAELWNSPKYQPNRDHYGIWGTGVGDQLVLSYIEAISELAAETGAIFVDVYHALEGAEWLINNDGAHYNDMGQRAIGLTVFSQLAASCSCLSKKSAKMEASLCLTTGNTGGTEALPYVIETWRRVGGGLWRTTGPDSEAFMWWNPSEEWLKKRQIEAGTSILAR